MIQKYKTIISILISFLLHLSLIYLIFLIKMDTPNKGFSSKNKLVSVTVLPKAQNTNKSQNIKKDKGFKMVSSKSLRKCPNNWYGGIGIQVEYDVISQINTIKAVFKGYPAELAGLRVWDIIEDSYGENIIGEVNKPIKLKVRRGGQVLNLTLIRDKVCY